MLLPVSQVCWHSILCLLSVSISMSMQKMKNLLIRNWSFLIGICFMVNARSDWMIVVFDL